MKNIILFTMNVIFIVLSACESDIEMIRIQDGIPSVVESNVDQATTITLVKDAAEDTVYVLDWTNTDYLGDTISSVPAMYALEINTSYDFTDAVVVNPPIYLQHNFLGVEINTILVEGLGATVEESVEVFFRVQSTFNDDVLYSNAISNTFVPYRLVELPAVWLPPNETIYIAGNAAGKPWPLVTTFTKVSETIYSLETYLIGGETYEFVTDPGWSQAYKIPADVNPADVALAGTFIEDGNKAHDENGNEVSRWEGQKFLSPPEDGLYLITLNFQTGTYTVEEQ